MVPISKSESTRNQVGSHSICHKKVTIRNSLTATIEHLICVALGNENTTNII